MLTHTDQRPFGCHTCGKRFRQPTHLRIHSRTHLWPRNGKQTYAQRSRPPLRRMTEYRGSPVGVQFQEKLPEKLNFDRNFHLNSPTESQSGQVCVQVPFECLLQLVPVASCSEPKRRATQGCVCFGDL
uniref:C2H2-type domain-containing protein n=1 Tax=Salmo trutta TaxID=8032 RepID=A0A674BRK6_SALTR